MLPDKKVMCHHTGFARSCADILKDTDFGCPKWTQIAGTNPNTGEAVNRVGCVDSFLPMLLIENSKETRQAAAAIESFRNEMVLGNNASLRIQAEAVARLGNPAISRIAK